MRHSKTNIHQRYRARLMTTRCAPAPRSEAFRAFLAFDRTFPHCYGIDVGEEDVEYMLGTIYRALSPDEQIEVDIHMQAGNTQSLYRASVMHAWVDKWIAAFGLAVRPECLADARRVGEEYVEKAKRDRAYARKHPKLKEYIGE